MADERESGAAQDVLTGFERYEVQALRKILANLDGGIDKVQEHVEAGTEHDRPKRGAATPWEAGHWIAVLRHQVTETLKQKESSGDDD